MSAGRVLAPRLGPGDQRPIQAPVGSSGAGAPEGTGLRTVYRCPFPFLPPGGPSSLRDQGGPGRALSSALPVGVPGGLGDSHVAVSLRPPPPLRPTSYSKHA